METVSDSNVTQEEEFVDESQSDILDIPEDNESVLGGTEFAPESDETVDVSGNDASLPSEDDAVDALPDAIALDAEQFETLIAKQEEINQNIHINTCMTSLLLGVLIGIIFVRGLSNFVRGV